MSKPTTLITCQPIDTYWIWQNHAYIESCVQNGFREEDINILLYIPPGRQMNDKWWELKEYYPKLNIHVYEDKGVGSWIPTYIPILRPHILWQHFEKHPHLKEHTIVYTDCDVLWTENMDVHKLLDDDVNYISDASSYLNADYFESKYDHAKEDVKEEFRKLDFLAEACSLVGIDKQLVIDNNKNTGGVQYILKNMDAEFWKKVERDTLNIRLYFLELNRKYYESENRGIQSWCADLWGVLWNLWQRGVETKAVPEMEFAWSTDHISKIERVGIFHNAGVTGEMMGDTPFLYKGKYHLGTTFPFNDEVIEETFHNEKNKQTCNNYYIKKLFELKHKYNLKYN